MKRSRQTARVLTFSFACLWFLVHAKPLIAQDITVSSADPNTAAQGTVNLNVTVSGKGFKRGAVAKFFVTGTTNPGGITVNFTTFVNPTQIVGNINIADNATISKFDIDVQNADGRTGVGIELFNVLAKGTSTDPLARANFRDAGLVGSPAGSNNVDRIQSDGKVLPTACLGYDYADDRDPCLPGYQMHSYLLTSEYFMRTVHTNDPSPTRYLVLDFTDTLSGSSCLGLDTKLLSDPARNPAAFSPENPDPCIDYLEVRFRADKAFAPGAQFTPVNLLIDAPDLKKIQGQLLTQWDAKYAVDFVNPLTITPDPTNVNTIFVTTIAGLEQAELWTINQRTGKKETLLGTYRMPFQVKITKLP